MKFIKNHLMFILPLIAILSGIEFFLVFDRTTDSYEKGLNDGYSMLVVTTEAKDTAYFQSVNKNISFSEAIKRKDIISEVTNGISESTTEEILGALPYFYNVGLKKYMGEAGLEQIKSQLLAYDEVKKVETFGSSYNSSYRLFSFIKFSLKLFISFMGIVSLFLIIKQMEIWRYSHKQRMQIMEIFGAPLMLRSGILFKVAIFDAFIATLLTSSFFIYIKFIWAKKSGIDIMMEKQEELFRMGDMGILLASALLIVIIAVFSVAVTSKGVQE